MFVKCCQAQGQLFANFGKFINLKVKVRSGSGASESGQISVRSGSGDIQVKLDDLGEVKVDNLEVHMKGTW